MSTPSGSPSKELKRSNYRLLGLVGQGQFGWVYCAVHRRTGQFVALKDLHHERFPTHKFLRELRFLLSLEHRNIVTCRALEHTQKGRYLVMDYCEGGTLRGLMQEDVRLSMHQCIKLVADILVALEHAHSRGIVHCDIKPENILLNVTSHGWTARVSDFGIARLIQEMSAEPHSGSGNTGSPAYMAPERFYGQYSTTSDLYSVGIILYELLAGDRPFTGTPANLMAAHLNDLLVFPDSIPTTWHVFLNTALEKLSARRFATAGDMLHALKQAAEAEGILGYLESQPVSIPLLSPTAELPPEDLFKLKTERIGERMQAIALLPETSRKLVKPYPSQVDFLYRTKQGIVLLAHSETHIEVDPQKSYVPQSLQPVPLPEPVRWLESRPTGLYALGNEFLHRLTVAQGTVQSDPLIAVEADSLAAITPSGHWGAIAHSPANQLNWHLHLHGLCPAPNTAPPMRDLMLPRPAPQAELRQLVALDERHFVALFRAPTHDGIATTTKALTYLEIMTRRGKRLGHFSLPLHLDQFQATPFPYRCIATDAEDPTSLLAIDLKPYRIIRFALNLQPRLLTTAPWGYVVADAEGGVELLDEYGQLVGRLELPFPPTALAPFEPHGLLIATWTENWGYLYIANLKTLEIQLLF
ncbi:MAG: serine/threonine-protein kinase [Cyanobacteria bacterium J06638_20]